MFSAMRKTARSHSLRLLGVKKSMQNKLQGRPKIGDLDIKRHNLTIRLSDRDLLILDEKCLKAGFSSYSKFLREASLGRELPKSVPEVNLKVFLELGRLGANINQLLKKYHEGCFVEEEQTVQLLNEIYNLVQIARKEVRGNDWQAEDRQRV